MLLRMDAQGLCIHARKTASDLCGGGRIDDK